MLQISAQKRTALGRKVKGLRKEGLLPAVVYGKGLTTEPISIKEGEFLKVWRAAGESSLVELNVEGGKRNVLIHDVSLHPIEDTLLHVDFYQVRMDELLRTKVQLAFEGEPPAVKNLGGILVKVMHEVEVEALPADLPHELIADLSVLAEIGGKLAIKDIKLPAQVKIIAEPEETIALIEAPRSEEEILGEAQPMSLESIEVVGKKKEEEGEEAAEGDASKPSAEA